MSIPDKPLKYYEKSATQLAIENTVQQSDGNITHEHINYLKTVASVQIGIAKYRQKTAEMSRRQLENETHDSARLGRFLESVGNRRPPRCHAHAIVSGAHDDAVELRTLLAVRKVRIDDPDNGCWLPENTAATPHPSFPKAIPHSRIHRYNYYFWLRSRLNLITIKSENILRQQLRFISQHLHENTMPEYVMLKKGEGLKQS